MELSGYIKTIKNSDQIKNELIAERNAYLNILLEVLDKEFPKRFSTEHVEELIKDTMQKELPNALELIIDLKGKASPSPNEFYINKKIKNTCCKRILGIFSKQVKYLDVNLDELISKLEIDKIYKHSSLLKDIIENSISINEFISKYSERNYSVSVNYNDEIPSLCYINISWGSTSN